VRDRVVQCAIKNLLEPIFEATFWHVSYGFRPGRGCHGALEHIRMTMRPRATASDGRRHATPYAWVIEGYIQGCFDNISHHHLMTRVRTRIGDLKVTRMLGYFLKAGVLSEGFLLPTKHLHASRWNYFPVAREYSPRRDRGAIRALDPPPHKDAGPPTV
jgi:retron-type reverse transcriptase